MDGRLVNNYYSIYNNEIFLTWVLRTKKEKIIVETPCHNRPHCFVPRSLLSDIRREAEKAEIVFEEVDREDKFFAMHPEMAVSQIITKYPPEVGALRRIYEDTPFFEYFHAADILFNLRVLLDEDIYTDVRINEDDWSYEPLVESEAIDALPNYKALFWDIEQSDEGGFVDMEKKRIISIAGIDLETGKEFFFCDDKESVIMECFWDLIQDYDHLLSWNGEEYDIPVLTARLRAHGHNPDWRHWQHIDFMLLFLRRHRDFSSGTNYLGLDDVAQLYLGYGKIKHEESFAEMFAKNRKLLEEYNLRDCKIMRDTEKLFGFYFRDVGLSRTIGAPIDTCKYPSHMVEMLVFRESKNNGCLWRCRPTKLEKKGRKSYTGAAQLVPVYGVHFNVIIIDWKSLYNRIMQTFGCSPENWDRKKKKFGLRKDPIFPIILERLEKDREEFKAQRKSSETDEQWRKYDALQDSQKTLLLVFYGVIGAKHSRFWDYEVAGEVTAWGRRLLIGDKEMGVTGVEQIVKDMNMLPLYGHTDSIALKVLEENPSKERMLELANELIKRINDYVLKFLSSYGIPGKDHKIQMDLQGIYSGMFLPKVKARHAELLAYDPEKERWLDPPKFNVKGFEIIRSNREQFTREFQRAILMRILRGDSLELIIKSIDLTKKRLLKGEFNDMLRIKTGTKSTLSAYKSNPPHVIAARKLDEKGLYLPGMRVEYVFTQKKGTRMDTEPIIDDVTPEIHLSGLVHYWNNRTYGWLTSIMDCLMPVELLHEKIGKIKAVRVRRGKKKKELIQQSKLMKFFKKPKRDLSKHAKSEN